MTRPALLLALALLAAARPARAVDWEQATLPFAPQYRLGIAPNGDVYASGGGMVHVSTDEGATWTPVGPFIMHGFIQDLAFATDGTIYATDIALGVYRSTDGGLTWSTDLVTEGADGIIVHPDGVVMAGLTYTGNGKVHRSTDDGATWQAVPLPGACNCSSTNAFALGEGGETYAGTIDGFYRSADAGVSWEAHHGGLLGRNVRALAALPNQHLVMQTTYPAQVDGIYRSTDRGDTWQRAPGNVPFAVALVGTSDGAVYAAQSTAVGVSLDEGMTWGPTGTGIGTSESLVSLVVTPSGRLLTGGRRVYRSTTRVTGVSPRRGGEPIALSASRPNPSRGTSTLGFSLAAAGPVDLGVFDLAGRRVATLATGTLAPGQHVARFDAAGLPPAVYLVRLQSGGRYATRRLALIR